MLIEIEDFDGNTIGVLQLSENMDYKNIDVNDVKTVSGDIDLIDIDFDDILDTDELKLRVSTNLINYETYDEYKDLFYDDFKKLDTNIQKELKIMICNLLDYDYSDEIDYSDCLNSLRWYYGIGSLKSLLDYYELVYKKNLE